ncbi:hypothetical protein LCER1_G004276 [Lachnellula cervina]|uniref:ABM domain-containing protein n=1 Tax=Lachnellula cervina TaxID=1316786 RepID=A0A7D8YN51_9HELO|nr:hypothetical protein LCER1_G004276 [Lachnellula cervina]
MELNSPQKAKKQLTLFVTFQVAPENIEKFKEIHRPVWKACSEEVECLLFDVFQDPDQPGRFRFVEIWSKVREWFEKEQMTKPYYALLWERSKPLWKGIGKGTGMEMGKEKEKRGWFSQPLPLL